MEYHYYYGKNNSLTFTSDSIYEVFHELVSDCLHNCTNTVYNISVTLKPSRGKRHIVIFDTLSVINFVVKSTITNEVFDLKNSTSLRKIHKIYDEIPLMSKIDQIHVNSIESILNNAKTNVTTSSIQTTKINQPVLQQSNQPQEQIQMTVSQLSSETSQTLQHISDLTKLINTTSNLENVQFRDEVENAKRKNKNQKSWRQNYKNPDDPEKSDSENSYIYDEDNFDEYERARDELFTKTFAKESKKKKVHHMEETDSSDDESSNSSDTSDYDGYACSCDSDGYACSCDSEQENDTDLENSSDSESDEELSKIKQEIKKMKQIKEQTKSVVKQLETVVSKEKEHLSKYNCIVNEEETKLRRERERISEDYNKFVAERDTTYGLIYNKFFIRKEIKGWDCVPPLFMIKFPIYLFLDGRDTTGKRVRDKILDTKDDFRMYRLLYDSLTDDEFNMPDDEHELELVNIFIDTFPPEIEIITEHDLMNGINLNDAKHKVNRRMFEEDDTSQCSEEENDDDEKTTLNVPKIGKC